MLDEPAGGYFGVEVIRRSRSRSRHHPVAFPNAPALERAGARPVYPAEYLVPGDCRKQSAPRSSEASVVLLVVGATKPRRLHAQYAVIDADPADRHLAVVGLARLDQHRGEGSVRHLTSPAVARASSDLVESNVISQGLAIRV